MPSVDDENIDHVQRKLNKILETRYDTDKVRKTKIHRKFVNVIIISCSGCHRFAQRLVNILRSKRFRVEKKLALTNREAFFRN